MPTPINYQHRPSSITYRIVGEISDTNVVSLHLTVVDDQGELRGTGDVTFPLAQARLVREALSHVTRNRVETVDPQKAYTVEERRQTDPQAYAKWDDESEAKLAQLYRDGLSPDEVARQMGRTVGAVGTRLEKLGLIEDWRDYGRPNARG